MTTSLPERSESKNNETTNTNKCDFLINMLIKTCEKKNRRVKICP